MDRVITQDIYESAYYLTLNANIETVEVITENNKLICRFTFFGENIGKASLDYFNGKALVNLIDFRRCFSRINSLIGTARKEAKREVLK